MPIYRFVALNKSGREERGVVDAPGPQAARKALKSRGLYLRSLSEDTEKKDRELFPAISAFLYRVPRRDISLFVRQLGTLLEAGLPLDRSLDNIIDQTENQYLRKALIEIRGDVVEGETLSSAMRKHSAIFPPVYHNLVAIGEQTGAYEQALIRLADLEDRNINIQTKIMSAMAYPLFMMALMGLIIIFLLGVVMPQIEEIYVQMDQELPFITKLVLGLSSIITSWKAIFPIGIIGGGIYLFRDWKSTPEGRRKFELFLLRQPIIGPFLRKTLIARFARNLGVMLQSNVSLITSLQVAASVVNHSIFEKEIQTAIERIKEGSKISEALKESIVINRMTLGMIAAGELSDSVPKMISKVAEVAESDVDATIQKMSSLIEPVMMLGMGGLIIVIMVAMLLPMYSLTGNM